MKMKRILLYCVLLLLVVSLKGQDVVLNVEYPSVVIAGQQFNVTWTVNSGGGEFSGPSFTGFYKLMGPQTSYSSSTQIINGKITRETSYSYVYYLQAMKEGKYVIPPASFVLKNKTYYSDSLRIEVIGTNTGNRQNAVAERGNEADEVVEEPGDNIFI